MAEVTNGREVDTSAASRQSEWTRVVGQLKEEVGEAAYRSWLQPMTVERVEGGQAIVAAPTTFLRDWVAAHYADRILALWRVENGVCSGSRSSLRLAAG